MGKYDELINEAEAQKIFKAMIDAAKEAQDED